MPLADAIQGALRPSMTITWTDKDGTAVDLTDATITARLRRKGSTTGSAVAGSFSLVTAASGIFRWDYAAADVATPGEYEVQFIATYGSGTTPGKTYTADWYVAPAI